MFEASTGLLNLDQEDLHFITINKSNLPAALPLTINASPSSVVPYPFTFEHDCPTPSSASSQRPCRRLSEPCSYVSWPSASSGCY